MKTQLQLVVAAYSATINDNDYHCQLELSVTVALANLL